MCRTVNAVIAPKVTRLDSRVIPSDRDAMYNPSARDSAAVVRTALTGTARFTDTFSRKPGSCRSRAIANINRLVATWATRLFAIPQASAVAVAVRVANHGPTTRAAS